MSEKPIVGLESGNAWTTPQLLAHTSVVRDKLLTVLQSEDRLPNHACGLLLTVIRKLYWPKLRRSFDTPKEAYQAAFDPKMPGPTVVYVPSNDPQGAALWRSYAERLEPGQSLDIREIAVPVSPQDADRLSKEGGFLPLAHEPDVHGEERYLPYYVPGGRFNEVYGWDTDFIAMGLLEDGNLEDVAALIKHHLTEIELFGRVLNANRTYYLTRGQPPLFLHLVRSYAQKLAPEDRKKQRGFLARCLAAAAKEYETVWNVAPHATENGLARYVDTRKHLPPETEPGHFNSTVQPYADRISVPVDTYIESFNEGLLRNEELEKFVEHDGAVRESGHDTTNALVGRAAHLNTVDLNALLYRLEADMAAMLDDDFGGAMEMGGKMHTSGEWNARASQRRERMDALLWDAKKGMFHDFDFVTKEHAQYASPRGLYPLWAGCASPEQAQSIVRELLPRLEENGGLASSDEASRGVVDEEHPQRQWDYPAGWAPHQMLAWEGLLRYGFREEAQRLIYKWLHMITSDWIKRGTIVEKYDVVDASQEFHAEYGNVGAGTELLEGAGFGWTNASYQRGLALLEPQYREQLERLVPPGDVFANTEAKTSA